MVTICPTVMPQSSDPHIYRQLMDRLTPFANRIQIDLMDGEFAPHKNLNPIQLWWPEGTKADIHVMYTRPGEHLTTFISLKPHMIILHYESQGDIIAYLEHIKQCGIKAGLALLPGTKPEFARAAIEIADHVLIFGGKLGESSPADLSQLDKVSTIQQINPQVEIGWDGGATLENVKQIVKSGVKVVNSGGAIQAADDPWHAYNEMVRMAKLVYA